MRWLYTLTEEQKKKIAAEAKPLAALLAPVLRQLKADRIVFGTDQDDAFYAAIKERLSTSRDSHKQPLLELLERLAKTKDLCALSVGSTAREESKIDGFTEDVLFRIMQEYVLRQEFKAEQVPPFEQALYDEQKKRDWQLRQINASMKEQGYKKCDAHDMFKKTGIAHGRVIMSNPIIVPIFTLLQFDHEGDRTWQPIKMDYKTQDYWYGLGFAHKRTQDQDNNPKSLWIPAIYIDHKILSELQHYLPAPPLKDKHKPSDDERMATNILGGLRTIYALSLHDYIHHSIYSDVLNVYKGSKDEKPEPIPDFAALKGNREGGIAKDAAKQFLGGAYPPIYDIEKKTDDKEKHTERQGYDVHHIWDNRGIGENIHKLKYYNLEFHAEAMHRDTMQSIFARQKSPYTHTRAKQSGYGTSVKHTIIRQATEFLDSLEDFRQRTEARKDTKTANDMVKHLAVLAMGRFFRIVDMDDKALAEEKFTLSSGRTLSFKDAADRLQLPAFKMGEAFNLEQLAANPIILAEKQQTHFMMDIYQEMPTVLYDETHGNLKDIFKFHKKWPDHAKTVGLDPKNTDHLRAYLAAAKAIYTLQMCYFMQDQILNTRESAEELLALIRKYEKGETTAIVLASMHLAPGSPTWPLVKDVIGKFSEKQPIAQDWHFRDPDTFIGWTQQMPYMLRRMEEWLPGGFTGDVAQKISTRELSGFDGLQARTLFEGSPMTGWLQDMQPWKDDRYSTAEPVDKYREAFADNPELLERPAYKEALAKYEHYEAARNKKDGPGAPSFTL